LGTEVHGSLTETDVRAVTTVDAILNSLEADRTGNEAAKKERLRVQIGLKPNPHPA